MNKKKFSYLIIPLVIILLFVVAAAFLYFNYGFACVYFHTPNGEVMQTEFRLGEKVTLAAPPEIENYTFVGWKDEQGNIESRDAIRLFENTHYSAVYAVALETEEHVQYLFADEQGFFRPEVYMTRGEFAQTLYSLLELKVIGESSFMDVSEESEYYDAVSSLEAIGVLSGSRFHPDDYITKGELLYILSYFYPQTAEKYDIADVSSDDVNYIAYCSAISRGYVDLDKEQKLNPNELLTRADIAAVLNRVLGRSGQSAIFTELVGNMLDVSPTDPYYYDMAEAAIVHSYEPVTDGEKWTDSEPVSNDARGMVFTGTELYYISQRGYAVKNKYVGNLYFGSDSRYTSGDAELDQLVRDTLAEVIDDPEMDKLDMLKLLYNHTMFQFNYRKGNIYEMGDVSWEVEEAKKMLSTGRGNCYSYAAAFCQLAKAIGFDAEVHSGVVGIRRDEHGWVTIEIDHETYVFDPEIQRSNYDQARFYNMFMMDAIKARGWNYQE